MSTRRNRTFSNDYDDKYGTSLEDEHLSNIVLTPNTKKRYLKDDSGSSDDPNPPSLLDYIDEEGPITQKNNENGMFTYDSEDDFPPLGGSSQLEDDEMFAMDEEENSNQEEDFPLISLSLGASKPPKSTPNNNSPISPSHPKTISEFQSKNKRLPTKKGRGRVGEKFNKSASNSPILSTPKSTPPTPQTKESLLPTPPPPSSSSRQTSTTSSLSNVSFASSSSSKLLSTRTIQEVSDDELEEGAENEIMEIVANEEREGQKEMINVLIAGHVDAGKSTLMGHLLVKLGIIDRKTLRRNEKEAKEAGKGSFYLAWVLDEDSAERDAGITMDVAHKIFETETRVVRILDAPGHRDFIPAMIEGCAIADAALLVIPSSTNEFEDAFRPQAQTKEHATVMRAMGVRQVVVVVNKLDKTTPPWSYERYQQIKEEVGNFLISIGFKPKNVRFVPVSGLSGANLVDPILPDSSPSSIQPPKESEDFQIREEEEEEEGDWSWIREIEDCPSLIQSIDQFRIPPRPCRFPLRCVVTEVLHPSSSSSSQPTNYLMIQVVQGVLRKQSTVLGLPSGSLYNIQNILQDEIISSFNHHKTSSSSSSSLNPNSRISQLSLPFALPGSVVLVILEGAEEGEIGIGDVLCRGPTTPKLLQSSPQISSFAFDCDSSCSFLARIFTMEDISPPITDGANLQLHIHGVEVCVRVAEVLEIVDKSSSSSTTKKKKKKKKKRKRVLVVRGGASAIVRILVEQALVVEPFDKCKSLGSGVLRRSGQTVAVCVVLEEESEGDEDVEEKR